MQTHKQQLFAQAKANVTARHGARPRGGKVQHCAAPFPPFNEKAFIADLEATFEGGRWDHLVKMEYRRLEAEARRWAA